MPSGYTRSRARFNRDYANENRSYQRPKSNPLFSFIIAFIVIVGVVAIILAFKTQIAGLFGGAPTPTPTAAATPAPTPTPTDTPEPTPTPTPTPTTEPTPTPPPPTEDIRVNAVGNIVIDKKILDKAKGDGGDYDFAPLFAAVKDQTVNADLTLGTLATTLNGTDAAYAGSPKYNTPDSVLGAMKDAGFDVLNLAHSHIFDYKAAGATRTLDTIAGQGITPVGIFKNSDEYNAVTPFTVNGKTTNVAVLSYCNMTKRPSNVTTAEWRYIIKGINLEKIKSDVEKARTGGAQIVIVMLNWGTDSQKTPTSAQKEQAKKIIGYGVDLLIGSGPDYLNTLENVEYTKDGVSKKGIVAYSLGNFVSGNRTTDQDTGLILSVTFQKDNASNTVTIKDASYVPTYVYVDNKSNYAVLPAGKYTNTPDLLDSLTSTAKTRIKKVWDTVKNLLGSAVATPVDAFAPLVQPSDTTQPADTSQPTDTGEPDGSATASASPDATSEPQ